MCGLYELTPEEDTTEGYLVLSNNKNKTCFDLVNLTNGQVCHRSQQIRYNLVLLLGLF